MKKTVRATMGTNSQERPKVLYVDDDASTRRAFARVVGGRGFDVDLAESGVEAIGLAQKNLYPMVVTDLKMPGMDGMTLIQELRTLCKDTAFIIVTGVDELHLPQSTIDKEAIVGVLSKPWNPEELHRLMLRTAELYELDRRPNHQKRHRSHLLIGGNLLEAKLLKHFLGDENTHSIEQCARLSDAISYLDENDVDFVLAHLSLPDARGLDCVRRLQQRAPDATVVVMSTVKDEQLALRSLQWGAQDYLIEGQFDAKDLKRSLRQAQERKRAEQRLSQLAYFDPLTGLANRINFNDRLELCLARNRRSAKSFALMFLDVDYFKSINDTYGHDVGDELLVLCAKRLLKSVREYDTVARLGGDEFAIILDGDLDESMPKEIAGRIVKSFQRPFELSCGTINISSSVGVAIAPSHPLSGDEVLRRADTAMYEAKRRGRNRFHFFESGIVSKRRETKMILEESLRRGLEEEGYRLHYQPQINVLDGTVRGAEALLRLCLADGTLAPPAQFMNTLEDTGLIVDVGAWVIDEACKTLSGWRAAGAEDCVMAINLSPKQFECPNLVQTIAQAIELYDLLPESLEVEITESILMRDTQLTANALRGLKKLGLRIAIDDFGTGHSSLAYLERYQVDVLKIDPSFIHAMSNTQAPSSVADAIIGLGHKLGIQTVAEGVETSAQLNCLAAQNCDLAQGFFLGRPAAVWPPRHFREKRGMAPQPRPLRLPPPTGDRIALVDNLAERPRVTGTHR